MDKSVFIDHYLESEVDLEQLRLNRSIVSYGIERLILFFDWLIFYVEESVS
jgi:hypothetical protein